MIDYILNTILIIWVYRNNIIIKIFKKIGNITKIGIIQQNYQQLELMHRSSYLVIDIALLY